MRTSQTLTAALLLIVLNNVYAQERRGADLSRANDTVNRIREPDANQVRRSTGTPTAEEIARRENERERQRQAEESRRRQLDRHSVPAPSSQR
jgi:hypothetical protein